MSLNAEWESSNGFKDLHSNGNKRTLAKSVGLATDDLEKGN